MAQDTILINNIYAGDYTNENIGHEIINSYKPDNGEDYYVYVSPHGHVIEKWDDRIKTILFTRNAGKNRLEVIAKAEIKIEEQEEFTKNRSELKNLSLTNKEGLDKQKTEWKDLVKTIDLQYIKFKNEYQNWEKKCRDELKLNSISITIEDLIQKYPIPNEDIKIKDDYKKASKYIKWLEDNKQIDCIRTWENSYDNWKNNYFSYLKNFTKKHLAQVQYIYSNEIKYGNEYLCDIFKENEFDAFATYFGFKTRNLTRPITPIYLEYGEYKEGKNKNKIEYSKCVTVKDEQNNIISRMYPFKHVKLANQKCYKFLNKEEFDKNSDFEKFENEFRKNEENNFIPVERLNEETKEIDKYKKSFLVMIKKQYDELSYSNMFYHFFNNNKNLFLKFAKEVLSKNFIELYNITDVNTYDVKREYNDIDLLIIADNKIFIIENKIKSGINGIQHDPYNEDKYCNQLTKYYDIIDNEYRNKKIKIYPFIFKPNYNQIETRQLKKLIDKAKDKALLKNKEIIDIEKHRLNEIEIINKANHDKNIIDKYCAINYRTLYKFFKDHETELSDNEFREQFLLSLELHTADHENVIERDMELKFREAIKQ